MINQPIMDPFNLYSRLTEEDISTMEAAVEAYKKLPIHFSDEKLNQWKYEGDKWAESTEKFCKEIRELNEICITLTEDTRRLHSNPYYKTFVESRIPSKPSIWEKIKQFFNFPKFNGGYQPIKQQGNPEPPPRIP
jgi:hypothetical protein